MWDLPISDGDGLPRDLDISPTESDVDLPALDPAPQPYAEGAIDPAGRPRRIRRGAGASRLTTVSRAHGRKQGGVSKQVQEVLLHMHGGLRSIQQEGAQDRRTRTC